MTDKKKCGCSYLQASRNVTEIYYESITYGRLTYWLFSQSHGANNFKSTYIIKKNETKPLHKTTMDLKKMTSSSAAAAATRSSIHISTNTTTTTTTTTTATMTITRRAMYVQHNLKAVRKSLLLWKSNIYYLLVCVCMHACMWVPGRMDAHICM